MITMTVTILLFLLLVWNYADYFLRSQTLAISLWHHLIFLILASAIIKDMNVKHIVWSELLLCLSTSRYRSIIMIQVRYYLWILISILFCRPFQFWSSEDKWKPSPTAPQPIQLVEGWISWTNFEKKKDRINLLHKSYKMDVMISISALLFRFPTSYIWILRLVLDFHTLVI